MTKPFGLKLILFLLPFFTIVLSGLGFSIYTGDAMPYQMVADLQFSQPPVLYNTTTQQQIFHYKLTFLPMRQIRLLILGSSRMLGFRSLFANKMPDAAYNAAVPSSFPDITLAFLDALDDSVRPEVIIWGLDQVWFNADFENWGAIRIEDNPTEPERILLNSRDLWMAILKGEAAIDSLFSRVDPIYGGLALGRSAILTGTGYRSDGSYQLSRSVISDPLEANRRLIAGHIRKFEQRVESYQPGTAINLDKIALIDRTLADFRAQGVTVIGFLPPYAAALYERMMASGDFTYIEQAAAALQSVFERHNFAFYDFSDARSIGVSDQMMWDGWHMTERASLLLYLRLLEAQPDLLGQYSDAAFLEEALRKSEHPYEVFANG